MAPDINGPLLFEKLSKLSLPSSEAVYNVTLLSKINYKLSHFMMRPLPSFAEHKTIRSLSNNSAPGPNRITNALIKGAVNVFIPVVC